MLVYVLRTLGVSLHCVGVCLMTLVFLGNCPHVNIMFFFHVEITYNFYKLLMADKFSLKKKIQVIAYVDDSEMKKKDEN